MTLLGGILFLRMASSEYGIVVRTSGWICFWWLNGSEEPGPSWDGVGVRVDWVIFELAI